MFSLFDQSQAQRQGPKCVLCYNLADPDDPESKTCCGSICHERCQELCETYLTHCTICQKDFGESKVEAHLAFVPVGCCDPKIKLDIVEDDEETATYKMTLFRAIEEGDFSNPMSMFGRRINMYIPKGSDFEAGHRCNVSEYKDRVNRINETYSLLNNDIHEVASVKEEAKENSAEEN
jgi:hypothetical protein